MKLVTCPSGLSGYLRKMRVEELYEMNESAQRGGTDGGFWRVLSKLWAETVDPGPYPFIATGTERIDVRRLLMGDAMHMLLQARIVSLGTHHEFTYQCPRCRERSRVEMDLEDDIVLQPLNEEAAATLRAGKAFEARTLVGGLVRYRLATVAHDDEVVKLRKQLERDVKNGRRKRLAPRGKADLFAAMTTFIEELGEEKSRDQRARYDWFLGLEVADEIHFDEQVSANDCGYDDAIQHVCDNEVCRARNEVGLPFDSALFRPSKLSPKTKETTATSSSTSPTTTSPSPEPEETAPVELQP